MQTLVYKKIIKYSLYITNIVNMSRTTMSVTDAFNEYYKLKSKYESDYNKDKQKIIKTTSMSWKEKREAFKKLKPKCINCKRPVGTIFSIKKNSDPKNDFRELKAICGSLTEPCSLNISINAGVTYNILDNIAELEKDVQNYKNEIIEYKNKLLFGYTSPESVIENSDKTKEAINDISFLLNMNFEHLFDIIDNKTKNEKILKTTEKIYILINEIKTCIKNFDTTSSVQYIRDAVDIYVNQLEINLKELAELKYGVNLVEFDDSEGIYRLIQKKNSIEDLEDKYVQPEIVSFEFGEIYTGKRKPTKEFAVQIESDKTVVQTNILPSYEEDGTVTWENQEYQKVWNNIPFSYKKALLEDKKWLIETMNQNVKNKRENKIIGYVPPSNLIIPPQILEDGNYDFGNKTYNNVFNKFDKAYQKTLLTLYSEKNGVRNYDMMIDAMNNIIKQTLGIM